MVYTLKTLRYYSSSRSITIGSQICIEEKKHDISLIEEIKIKQKLDIVDRKIVGQTIEERHGNCQNH